MTTEVIAFWGMWIFTGLVLPIALIVFREPVNDCLGHPRDIDIGIGVLVGLAFAVVVPAALAGLGFSTSVPLVILLFTGVVLIIGFSIRWVAHRQG